MKKTYLLLLALFSSVPAAMLSQDFDGLDNNLSSLYMLSDAQTRSISPENFTGEPGKGGMAELGEGSASRR